MINDGTSATGWGYTLERGCDLVGDLDMVLHNPRRLAINDLLVSVEVNIGGHCIDKWRQGDIGGMIRTATFSPAPTGE
jgi:hypothetical protein